MSLDVSDTFNIGTRWNTSWCGEAGGPVGATLRLDSGVECTDYSLPIEDYCRISPVASQGEKNHKTIMNIKVEINFNFINQFKK